MSVVYPSTLHLDAVRVAYLRGEIEINTARDSSVASPAVLGFGTGHLMGRIGSRESARLVHAALDCGLTHFDTARLYGFGDAEQMLGNALKRRADVSVYTKVGQGSSRHSALRAELHSIARPAARVRAQIAHARGRTPGPAIRSSRRTRFYPAYVRASVETSLRLLQRDVLDGLLLHEITAIDLNPELLELMEALILEGKVRRFGIASESAALPGLAAVGLPGTIVQQPGSPFVKPFDAGRRSQLILHSVFGERGRQLNHFKSWLSEHPKQLEIIMALLQANPINDIPGLLINYTLTRWKCTRLLFASTSERHIRDNASAVQQGLSAECVLALSGVVDSYKSAHEWAVS